MSRTSCGCGSRVPVEQGPTHAYLRAAPACWRRYGELTVQLRERDGVDDLLSTHVDCFAAQHVDGADVDLRQRRSVAVHLVALSLHLEHGTTGRALSRARQRTSAVVLPAFGLDEWPWLEPPARLGRVTVADLHAASADELPALARAWPAEVWAAWHQHHAVVGCWSRHLHRVVS